MYFSSIFAIYIQFMFYQRISSSQDTFSQTRISHEVELDDILKKFFGELNKSYLQKYNPRHITVVGSSRKNLLQSQPFFESFPSIICRDSKKCGYSRSFSQGSLVIVFLEDLSEKAFRKNIHVLSRSSKSKVLFVSEGSVKTDDIVSIFTLALEHNLVYSELAHLGRDKLELYKDFIAPNCSAEARVVDVWSPGTTLNKLKIWLSRSRDMNGCPVSVSSLTFEPKMMIREKKDGSLTITGGREGNLVLELAKRLNFTIALRYPSFEDQLQYSGKGAILNDVSSGISEFGIGRLRPTRELNQTHATSMAYDEECVTWSVPRVIIWSNDVMLVEFSWQVWALVSFVFTVCCVVGYAQRNTMTSEYGTSRSLGFVTILLDVVAMHLGNPVLHVSSSAGGKFMLTACLYYATVITTAYKTSLASILTTNEGTPKIVDAQGIIDSNLNVKGTLYDYNILKDQVNDSTVTAKLLERMIVNNNNSFSWEQLMAGHNSAFLSRRSSFDFDRQTIFSSRKVVTYDVLDGCVLAYGTVIVFQTTSFLRKPVDRVIERLTESGILRHWDIDKFAAGKLLKRKSVDRYFEDRETYKFRYIFIFYSLCMSVSVLTFFIELYVSKITRNKPAINRIEISR